MECAYLVIQHKFRSHSIGCSNAICFATTANIEEQGVCIHMNASTTGVVVPLCLVTSIKHLAVPVQQCTMPLLLLASGDDCCYSSQSSACTQIDDQYTVPAATDCC
jgi:hypothetical protein